MCVFSFGAQLSGNFLNIAFFFKKGCNCFFDFLRFKFKFCKFSFSRFAKTLLKYEFQLILVFFVVAREEKGKNKWQLKFLDLRFFCPKMAVSWRISVFQKMPCWNLYFYSVFWVRAFLAKLSKKGKFWTPTKNKRKIWLITEKLNFWYFCVFSFSCSFLFLCLVICFFVFSFFFLFLFFWVLGSGEVARRATSLGPKPSLFVFFFVFVFVLFFVSKGHLTWP